MKFVLRTLAASLVLFLFGVAHHHSWGDAASALLVCTMLCWITARSQTSGAELVVTLAGFYFILVSLTTIPEGVLFDVIKVGQAPLMMAPLLVVALGIAVAITLLFQKSKATPGATPIPSANMTIVGLVWRLAAAVVVFMFCYFAAGMLIYPLVKSYYVGRNMPEPVSMVAMVVLRVMCLIVAAWLAVRKIPSRRDARLILATAFPVIGVFSLMLPHNTMMPPAVRLVHTMEMAPYYSLCGFLFAVWFGPLRASENSAEGSQS